MKKLELLSEDKRVVISELRKLTPGCVYVSTWDGEKTLILQYMTMQNGQVDVAAVDVSIDTPIRAKVFSSVFNREYVCKVPNQESS
jgi:hypothetical protein